MYYYRPTTDEQTEDKLNQKEYKKYSYDEIKKIVEDKREHRIEREASRSLREPQKPIKKSLKNIMKKHEKPNSANLFYNLFD